MNKKLEYLNKVSKVSKVNKVNLGSIDDMLSSARNILQHAEEEMPIRLRDWRSALSAADDFGVEVSFEARMLEEDLDILAMKLEDLGLSPSDIDSYNEIMDIVEKLNTIQHDAHEEIGSGM